MTATTEGVFSPALRLVTVGLLVSVGIVAFDGLGVTTALKRPGFRSGLVLQGGSEYAPEVHR